MEDKLIQLNVRIPRTLKRLIKDYIEMDAHKDISEFTRDALREKIERDAPQLYQRLFRLKEEAQSENSQSLKEHKPPKDAENRMTSGERETASE